MTLRTVFALWLVGAIALSFNGFALSAPGDVSIYSVEAETGIVLYEQNPDAVRPPASMIKLVQMLLVSEGIEEGRWTLATPITASRKAQHMGGTQVYLRAGEVATVKRLMEAVAVASANDAAMAVAEGLWGDEETYLAAVNARVRELGMTNSEFHSVHGLPPDRGEQPDRTSARDMALLARECIKHPRILEWCRMERIRFRPGEDYRYTTNRLMRRMPECDGLKTGYIRAAGFCITATAKRGDIRIVTVVMGHPNSQARFDLAEDLLRDGLDAVRRDRAVMKDVLDLPRVAVENSETEEIVPKLAEDIWVTARKEDWERLAVLIDVPERLQAPVSAGTEVGRVRVELDGKILGSASLFVLEDLAEAGWRWKFERRARGFFGLD